MTYSSMFHICKHIIFPLTCRLRSGEDKFCGAAALDLSIAGMNVNAVNCERLEARDLQLTLRHCVLHELKLPVRRLHICAAAAVTSSLERRDSAAVGVQPAAARVSGVGDAKEISATSIRRPGDERNAEKVERARRKNGNIKSLQIESK